VGKNKHQYINLLTNEKVLKGEMVPFDPYD